MFARRVNKISPGLQESCSTARGIAGTVLRQQGVESGPAALVGPADVRSREASDSSRALEDRVVDRDAVALPVTLG